MNCHSVFTAVIWFLVNVTLNNILAIYTDQWAVRIKGGEESARQVAGQHGFVYVAKVGMQSNAKCYTTRQYNYYIYYVAMHLRATLLIPVPNYLKRFFM